MDAYNKRNSPSAATTRFADCVFFTVFLNLLCVLTCMQCPQWWKQYQPSSAASQHAESNHERLVCVRFVNPPVVCRTAHCMFGADQDQQLDLISKGVSNLKNYSVTVKDETDLHVRLLNDIDSDVSRATDGLETEAERAAKVWGVLGSAFCLPWSCNTDDRLPSTGCEEQ